MIQHAVSAIGGVGNLGVISLCLFFIVFTSSFIWALAQKKALMRDMSILPLNDNETKPSLKGASKHE